MKPRVWETQDIALAGYVNMVSENSRLRGEDNGVRLIKVVPNGRTSTYVFKDFNDNLDGLIVEFPGTESFRFDAMVGVLKSMGHSRKRKDRRPGGNDGRRER